VVVYSFFKPSSNCVDQIQKLKNCSISCFSDRVSGKTRYVNCLFASKVGISPWGLGEKCYRDFEAMYCGCILIKPDTSFVRTYPDIYLNNKTYIPCKIDFSDLQEKVDYIIHDSPFILGLIYIQDDKHIPKETFGKLIAEIYSSYDNLNIFLSRNINEHGYFHH
jgi:hypothetical protein